MASAPAYAPVIHAASGYELAYNQYQRGSDRPANNGIFIADVMGASYAFGAIQLALYEREKSGRGQHIDVSLMDSVLGMLIYEMQAAQFPPERPRQVYEPVRASDGYVMVAAVTQKNLEVLFDTIGYPEGKTDPRFATMATKEANWPALLALIERWTSLRTGAECEQVFMTAGVPCSRYRSVAEAMADPQCAERGLFVELGAGDASYKVANVPYRLSATPVAARPFVAGLGEHTDEVLRERSSLDAAAIAALRAKGTFGKGAAHDRPVRRRPGLAAGRRGARRCCATRCAASSRRTGRRPTRSSAAASRDALVAALGAARRAGPRRASAATRAKAGCAKRPSSWRSSAAPRARRRCSARCLANLAFAGRRRRRRPAAALLDATSLRRRARVCLSFAAADPNADAAAPWSGEPATGTLRFVDGGGGGDASRRRDDARGAGLADRRARPARLPGSRRRARSAPTARPRSRWPRRRAAFVAAGRTRRSTICCASPASPCWPRAHGAARRAFEMAVDYAKERRQFGQPIGRFQAIQHKLANNLIALEGVRLTLDARGRSLRSRRADWRYFAAAAVAFAAPALRQVSLETHHAFGAIGYAEEHEAPRHFRRAHLDALALGGAAAARRELAAHLLDDPTATLPEYDLGAAGNAFRERGARLARQHWAASARRRIDAQDFHEREFDPSFARDLGTTGWLGLGWPREFGGQARRRSSSSRSWR